MEAEKKQKQKKKIKRGKHAISRRSQAASHAYNAKLNQHMMIFIHEFFARDFLTRCSSAYNVH